jgi:hypothetical protein
VASPIRDPRHVAAAREVVLYFRALTGVGDDPGPSAALTDTLAELIAALHHLADVELGDGGFDRCLERAAFNYAFALRHGEGGDGR